MTLHVFIADKFTKPFCHYISEELKLQDQYFLYLSDTVNDAQLPQNSYRLQQPLSKHLWSNLKTFYKLGSQAGRIVMHGDTLLHFFALFPWFLKKTGWVIYGQELYSFTKKDDFRQRLKRFVLSRVRYHVTHIEGDAELANKLFGSKAQFIYSPMYLSNVVETGQFKPIDISQKERLNVMVGNSTDPSNQHESIFERLVPRLAEIEKIYCPLSYGMYDNYKQKITELGTNLFGEKFVVLDQFMPFDAYKQFLADMDVVVFNHPRQEAMGVTLTLLGLGKIVYMNKNTTSYESLVRRGFKVFDNQLITIQSLKTNRDVNENASRLNDYYSKSIFDTSWQTINTL
jgi:hypothetical protein